MFRNLISIFIVFVASVAAHEVDREKMLLLLSGEWISRALYVTTKLDVADHLAEPKSVEELAKLTHSDPESLYRILHTLASVDVFREVSPRVFCNTEMSSLLGKSHPDTLHALSLFYGEDIHRSWDALFPSIQTGTPAFQLRFGQPVFPYFKEHPESRVLFQQAMREKSAAVIHSALASYDFSKFRSVYDIGGGQGQFLSALIHQYPTIQGTLFELPEVLSQVKYPDYTLMSGDFFISIPEGADAYLLKSVLHDWDDDKCKKILDNCYRGMGKESKLLIMDVVLQPKAVYANCMDLLMLAITGGKERNLEDFTRLLARSGFTIEKVYPTATEFSIIEAKKTDTLATYEASIHEYIMGTAADVTGQCKTWIDQTLQALPKTAQIIEIGSAFGRDAKYIESQGFQVHRTDATLGFVSLLQKDGYKATPFNILTDSFEKSYDLIFANAVFLHFTVPELKLTLEKAHRALNKGGLLAFSVKHGEGEEWNSAKVGRPRFFHYWNEEDIVSLLSSYGFAVLSMSEDSIFTYLIAKRA